MAPCVSACLLWGPRGSSDEAGRVHVLALEGDPCCR